MANFDRNVISKKIIHGTSFHLFSDLQKLFEVLSFPANLDTIRQTSAQKTSPEHPWFMTASYSEVVVFFVQTC